VVALHVLASTTLKSIAGVALIAAGAVGAGGAGGAARAHEPDGRLSHFSHHIVEASTCRDNRDKRDDRSRDRGRDHGGQDDDRGHDHGGHQDDGHGDDGHGDDGHGDDGHGDDGGDGGPSTGSGMLQQVVSVRVPSATFLRIDKSGRVIAAATNTRCRPNKQDDVYIFRAGGAVEPTTAINLEDCTWIGDFTVPGRFQPQECRLDHKRDKTKDS
jgi:hypothetical protein